MAIDIDHAGHRMGSARSSNDGAKLARRHWAVLTQRSKALGDVRGDGLLPPAVSLKRDARAPRHARGLHNADLLEKLPQFAGRQAALSREAASTMCWNSVKISGYLLAKRRTTLPLSRRRFRYPRTSVSVSTSRP